MGVDVFLLYLIEFVNACGEVLRGRFLRWIESTDLELQTKKGLAYARPFLIVARGGLEPPTSGL